jgi:hypothetical protein
MPQGDMYVTQCVQLGATLDVRFMVDFQPEEALEPRVLYVVAEQVSDASRCALFLLDRTATTGQTQACTADQAGVDLSLLLTLTGVLGGVIAFGIVGLFIGPVILAVTFALLQAWIDEEAPTAPVEPTLKSTGDQGIASGNHATEATRAGSRA